jgi:hypothetical protein
MLLLANMKFRQQDANELGDQEWVPIGPNVLDIAIFHDGEKFVVVMLGDEIGTAETLAEAKVIAENLGFSPDKPPARK